MNANRKKIVIIGATSSIARQCARMWVEDGPVELILVGRNIEKTELLASDIRVRSPQSSVSCIQSVLYDAVSITKLVNELAKDISIDIALIAHGSLPDQQQCQDNLVMCHDALYINGVSTVLLSEAFIGHMEKAGKGTLAVIGSVAGDRGRKSNYIYGAAKGMVARYLQGLQHRLAYSDVKIVLIKPGPTDTPMTTHLKSTGTRLASVECVARSIVNGIKKGKTVVYTPAKWMLIMMIIRHLPAFVFNELDI